ncbi:MAG: ABC transporter permease [Candidatus Thorarchaeota archaeon]
MQGFESIIGIVLKLTLEAAAPLVLAALGGMFSERSGVVNIGLEGIMLVGAVSAAAVSFITRNPWLGILVGVSAGAVMGLVHAIVCVKYKGNHIVSGTGIILFGAGFSTLMLQVVWGQEGASERVPTIPEIGSSDLSGIPFLGPLLGGVSPIVYFMFVLIIICWYVLYKTPFGLRLRAAGEDPSTLDAAGISVERMRYAGVILSGILAGLAGAYLSISFQSRFSRGMTSGRGFIALAAMIFGNWNPFGILFAGLFFGFLQRLSDVLQIVNIPALQFLQEFNFIIFILPYVLVVIALAGIRKSVPPKGIAVPYEKEHSG